MSNRFKVFLVLTILYALSIFYLSSVSSAGDPKIILRFLHLESLRSSLEFLEYSDLRFLLYPFYIFYEYPDKVEHIIQYAIFGFLLYRTLKNSSNRTLKNYAFIFAFIIGTAFGATDEFHQLFVPGRKTNIWDLLADSIGILTAQALIYTRNWLSISSKKSMAAILDLKLAVILIVASIIFILVPPYNQTFLRMILALPLLLFLPGYLFISVMFPRRGELGPIERFTLSIGLSIAIFVFDGFALNYTPWGFRPNSIVISLSTIMGFLLIAAYLQRWRCGETGYGFSFRDIISFYHTIRSNEAETGPEYDPALEKMLIKTMIIAILLVSAMLIYAKVTTEPEKFTTLYILGANGKAENYLPGVNIGEPATILVGVENYEYAPVNYTLRVQLGGRTLKEQNIVINHNDKWLDNVTFIPQLTTSIAFAGTNKSKLEFLLLKDNQSYRSVHLLVNTSLDSVRFAELPVLINGDMESDEGWMFSASPETIGSYTNNISSSRVYEINFTTGKAGSQGTIYQNLTTYGDARAVLSFDVRDSEYSNTSYYVLKRALIDDRAVWESRIGGKNSSWEHVEVPVMLSGNNTLAFQVYSNYGTSGNVSVWLDNVQLRPYAAGTRTENITKPAPKAYEFNFDTRGAPVAMNRSMKIDGFSFPGFYYDINQNKSGEELRLEVSNNNMVEAGNATYIARVNGSDLYLMGSRYRIAGKDPSNISKIIETYPNKTITLGKAWSFGDGYSLLVKLISSKSDSAMLELRKGGSAMDSRLINKGGIYEYRTKGKLPATLFKARIDSISGDDVYLTNIELYSDVIISLKTGTILADFETDNISSDELVFKNIYPFELNNRTVILNGSVGLSLQNDTVYPYASGVQIRGTPQSIYYGRWMNITGMNYPGFYLETNTSYEELSMYFSDNGFVEKGQAVYRARAHSGILSFLGNTYELMDPNKAGYISNVITTKKLMVYDNGTGDFDGRYIVSFQRAGDNKIRLSIRKTAEKDQQKLLNETIKSNTTFFPDIYYEMFTGRDGNLRKSNILSTGDAFEYWVEHKEDLKYKALAGELEAISNSSVVLNIKEYEIPFEIAPGRMFGEFEVESVIGDTITLRNTKTLQFMPGKETAILDDALKIRTSSAEYLAYPVR
ncbi:MAG: VanZ family protein [Candidatus Methanoperedens sp.]|nr:VanZ family protein [Candidatus Methanoperedens sp.]